MGNKLYANKQVVICTLLVFISMLIFFAIVHPIYPFDGDDVHYMSHFISLPVPYTGLWNPTRMLHEYLHPLTGYLAAFVIYPFSGDYLNSTSLALAIVLAVFISALFVSLYRLFQALTGNKSICAILGVYAIALCFALFRSKSFNNVHLFLSRTYTTYLAYTVPNIVNSIAVCELMRLFVKHKSLSISSSSYLRSSLMLVLLYFCIFSIQFALVILLSFALSFLLIQFFDPTRPKEKLFLRIRHYCYDIAHKHHITIIIIVGTLASMFLETRGQRAAWDSGNTFFGSIFSIEFIKRIYQSAKYLLGTMVYFNPLISLLLAAVAIIAVILWIYNRKKEMNSPIVSIAKICFASGLIYAACNCVLAAIAGPFLNGIAYTLSYSFGLYFYIVLFASLSLLYVLETFKPMRLLFPLLTIGVLLIAIDSKWPYADSFYSNPQGSVTGKTAEKVALMNSYIEQISQADRRGEDAVVLIIPEYPTDNNWPLSYGWSESLPSTLYKHRVTSRVIKVEMVIDANTPVP